MQTLMYLVAKLSTVRQATGDHAIGFERESKTVYADGLGK
jgi:hypothetical protein